MDGSLRRCECGSCDASVSTFDFEEEKGREGEEKNRRREENRGDRGVSMSGGNTTNTDDGPSATLRGESVLEQQDQEMKEDAPPPQPSVSCGANASPELRRAMTGPESTWNFVQMNMTLLPIARPLPVNATSRLHDGFFGGKPRTPNQKLHRRVLQSASNISPRRNEDNMLRRRGSTSSESGTAASLIPRQTIMERQYSAPTAITGRAGKRKSDYDDHYVTLPWPATPPASSPRVRVLEDESRVRSASEDLSMHSSRAAPLDAQLEGFTLSRSASTSSAFAHPSTLFKDKRILELQDEERRLHPDERASLPSPSKRSRYQ